MDIRTSRSRVNGLLHVKDGKLVNGIGEEVVLRGVGLGNWLLPEGYMWNFPGAWDRPRRIEEAIRTLCGTDYATRFWRVFRDTYVARRDIEMIAEMGFNSVRIPINARILQREEPGLPFIEEGFALIDRCLDWCEEFNLYAILDLHGAPGGQTGSNIDDSLDDIPRLFIDAESRQAALALWREIARRYRARDIVAAYDLLNEPLRTSRPNKPDTEYLHPELVRFYEDCIADIRAIDSRHAFSIEGANWATRTDTFLTRYDPNAIIHFHRYGTLPGEEAFDEWTALSRRLGIPAWLGESGENTLEWCAAIFPASVKVGAGFNFWSWKRMGRNPAPLEIRVPEGWDRIVDFGKGAPVRPTPRRRPSSTSISRTSRRTAAPAATTSSPRSIAASRSPSWRRTSISARTPAATAAPRATSSATEPQRACASSRETEWSTSTAPASTAASTSSASNSPRANGHSTASTTSRPACRSRSRAKPRHRPRCACRSKTDRMRRRSPSRAPSQRSEPTASPQPVPSASASNARKAPSICTPCGSKPETGGVIKVAAPPQGSGVRVQRSVSLIFSF